MRALQLLSLVWLCLGCNHLYYQPDPYEYLTPKALNLSYESLSIKSGEDTLAAWKIPARKRPAIGKILHFHGNAQNMTSHFLFVAWLAEEGFDVYVFDYRGYGQSSGESTRDGLYEDARAALKYVDERDNLPMVVIGQSLGGAVCIPAIATTPPANLKVLVIDSSFPSYRALAREKLDGFWLTWPLQYPLSFLISDDYSPMAYTKKINVPVLVMHGSKDRVISIETGRTLFNGFPEAHRTFWTISDGVHTSALQDGSPYRKKLVSFLRTHVQSSVTPQPTLSHD